MITRRNLIAGAAAVPLASSFATAAAESGTPAATPAESPVASTAPNTEEILPAWLDAQEELRQAGKAASEAFWQLDTDTLISMGTDDIAAALQENPDIQELLDSYTQNQVQFAFVEVGAMFSGRYAPEIISGIFFQGAAIPWEAVPDEEQAGDVPTGSWTGVIGPGIIDLGIELEFSGDAENLEVNLSIPVQMIPSTPMSDVVFQSEIPIGEMLDERVIPAGGDVVPVNLYAEQYEWGEHFLSLDMAFTGDGELAGIHMAPKFALPELPEHDAISMRLPFDGAWMVVWGGETEFRNYHAPVASQRYAADILLWQDGSTANNPGTENENYHAFGQPYLAPVSGTVAMVLDGLDDILPQQPGSNPMHHPAGNHVVIEASGGYIYLAHCQNGSILVQQGDTVEAGDVVAAVGNSGNTSEPHVHIHAQTQLDMFDPEAVGIPIVFENVLENGEPVDQLSILHGTIVEHRS